MATFRGAGLLVRQFSTTAVREKLAELPLKLYGVNGRYASALYSAAIKEKKLDVVHKEINAFMNLVETDPKLKDFLASPANKRAAKRDAIAKIAKSQKYNNLTANFFNVLSENGRIQLSTNIIAAFNKMMSAQKGEVTCVVTTAKALGSAEEKELKAALQGFAKSGKSLIIEMKVDPALLGGMVVSIGDKFIDMSIASKMLKYTNVIKVAV
ncbi:ATP synthase subunit O [Mactra antiquata]